MEIPTGEQDQGGEGGVAERLTVLLVREDGGESVTLERVCEVVEGVASLRKYVASTWNLPSQTVTLSYNGECLSDSATLEQLGAEVGQPLELQVMVKIKQEPSQKDDNEGGNQMEARSSEGEMAQTDTVHTVQTITGSDRKGKLMTVVIEMGHDQKEVLVRVEEEKRKKPFIGGTKHRKTGMEYHHAATQTMPGKRKDGGMVKFQRDTQTVQTWNCSQQATADAATQMDKTGCFVNSSDDKELTCGDYETADEYQSNVLEKVLILQRHWRRWLATQYVQQLREEKQRRQQWEQEELVRKARERELRTKREFERRINPKTKEDFELLYHALEMWRQDELQHINATTSGAERKAALCALLEQEAQLIASIGRHKSHAREEGKERDTKKFLDTVAAPKHWTAFDGNTTSMDTPYTIRAQQLRDLYNSITLRSLSRDERLDILLTLKCTVKEHDCTLTREIVELVDREADLLVREMDGAALEGLRKRIATLFFQYCKTPLFNPEAAKHIKVPQDPSKLRSNVYYCRSCCQYLPSTDFELSSNSRIVGHCRSCRELDNVARAREDFTLYRAMLKNIRRTEEAIKGQSHIIFLVQESDLRYIVENIWASQSALSAIRDLYELCLVRWDSTEQWSPWNCILLTKDEVKAHTKIDNVEQAYGSQFVRKVRHRHVLARSYFSRVSGMLQHMQGKVQALPLPPPKERVLMATGAGKSSNAATTVAVQT